MYVVTGASGQIGRQIVPGLLSAGKAVRVIGRSAERLQGFVDQGAEARVGDLEDADFVTDAFSGATVVFALIPPHFTAPDFRAYQGKIGAALITAIKHCGVPHVVNLSSIGADRSEGTGVVLGVHDHEERLKSLTDTQVMHLRPSYFMENLLNDIPVVKHMGRYGTPLRSDVAFPMIATSDIAAAATQHLLKLDFSGHSVHELFGPRDYSMQEVVPILGAAIGKPDLAYMQFSDADAEQGMIGAGMSASTAQALVAFNKFVNTGAISNLPRTPENTTPTTLEEFAPVFASAYHQQ